MKKTGIDLFISILILLAGCGRDLDQAKRYSEMKSECDSIIAQANLIIQDQGAKADSLQKIRDGGFFPAPRTPYPIPLWTSYIIHIIFTFSELINSQCSLPTL
ncbi:MAG: hypothetical protein NTY95_07235 [Bacteroidia bacterium]|jgi:hypothetical protein|nr:hypothetical protein [Bacteroidia bacterium]